MLKLNKKIFLLFLPLCGIFLRLTPLYGANFNPLHLTVYLEIKPNTIVGTLQTFLQEKKVYTFRTKSLIIKEGTLGENSLSLTSLKEGVFSLLSEKPNSPLLLSFERPVNFIVVPFNLVEQFIPLPEEPFTYDIVLKIPKKLSYFAFIFSEDYKVKEEGEFWIYQFKNSKPIKSPVLILSKEPISPSVLVYKNLKFSICFIDNKKFFSKDELSSWFQKVKTELGLLEKNFSEVYPFSNLWVLVGKEQKNKIDYANTLLVDFSSFNSPWDFVSLLTEKRLRDGIFYDDDHKVKGLVWFLRDLAKGKEEELRKKLLITSSLDGQSFFYFLELSQKIGEKPFLSRLKHFYETKLFTPHTFKDLLAYLKSSFPEVFMSFPEFSQFKKLYLKGEVVFLQPKEGGYELTLAFRKSNSPYTLTQNEREVVLKFLVVCKDNTYSFERTLLSPYQIFQVWIKERPEEVYLDPNYSIWRYLEKREDYVALEKLLEIPGIVFYPEEEFPIYQKIIEVLRNKGYKILPVKDPAQVPIEEGKNVIYLHKFPLSWMVKEIDKGFYFKLFPCPFEKEGLVGYFFSSSAKETELAINLLFKLSSLSEAYIKSGKIVFKRSLGSQKGILVPVRLKPAGYYSKAKLNTYELAIQLINTQLILIGEEKQDPSPDFTQFYKEFLENLHQLNENLIITLDLPLSYQVLIDQFFENKISIDILEKELSKAGSDVNFNNLIEVLRLAKTKKIKVLTIGVEEGLFQKVLTKGLLNLSQEEISNLPEMDLMNPLFKTYLYEKYQQEKKAFPPFENFYQAYFLKKEALTENLLKVLDKYSHFQIILITTKEVLNNISGITQGLEKKNFFNFKKIILDNQNKLSAETGDYFFNGGESIPR
ncbi:ChaN family lipoprotein [Thermodesulfobacterium sp. TA1]|uniref:ChaN family lipoprotein n=1 Tax=Thermodesulfobacterium sp. TA1 TaxID=2234087 RepID=UPI0012329215|nr:ChaN family lipoprotein [Thermodesulfobacterium sp. TA1]QER41571.1 ChaN family lipoprotein [Thermodesulfobacterium sp. TA1]